MLLMRVLFQNNLNFSMVVKMKTLLVHVTFGCLAMLIKNFTAFLISDIGKNIMTNSSLSKHNESENIFYQNFNTKKKISTVFIWHSKKKQKPQFQNVKNIFLLSQWITLKKLIFLRIKILNTYFINLTTGLNLWKEKN